MSLIFFQIKIFPFHLLFWLLIISKERMHLEFIIINFIFVLIYFFFKFMINNYHRTINILLLNIGYIVLINRKWQVIGLLYHWMNHFSILILIRLWNPKWAWIMKLSCTPILIRIKLIFLYLILNVLLRRLKVWFILFYVFLLWWRIYSIRRLEFANRCYLRESFCITKCFELITFIRHLKINILIIYNIDFFLIWIGSIK